MPKCGTRYFESRSKSLTLSICTVEYGQKVIDVLLLRGSIMTATEKNLKEAFAGESQANRKYLAFSKKAKLDGYPQIAKLFFAAAEAETVHAHAHLRVLGGIKSTAENLEAA